MATAPAGGSSRYLVLAAMIFAVAMTFIDQTIVSIAVPNIQYELKLTSTGVQWAVNAYLLTLAAFFAFGGRLADTVGHRRMVVIGVLIFAGASACCGLTPTGSPAEAWLIAFRAVQGFGGALMFPAALAIVVQSFALRERGRALALFFGVAGGLTAIGPVLGGYLTEWTWRAIFWVNLPVAAVALVLVAISKPVTESRPAPMDYRGLALIAGGVALSVFGFQQSQVWGWSNPAIGLCIAAGLLLLVVFALVEKRTASPLIQVDIFRIRAFSVQNLVLGISMLVFVPVFFFSSEYAQIALGDSSSEAGVFLLYFFVGFVIASQIGGRMLDRGGAKRPVVLGCVLAAVGFHLWAGDVTSLSFSEQQWDVVLAGAGMGFMLSPASTDAVNRASRLSYGEATGITQTVRNYAASLGLAVLGTVLVTDLRSRLTDSLVAQGLPPDQASATAAHLSQVQTQGQGGGSGGGAAVPQFFREDFAHATQTVFQWMAAVMAVAALVAIVGLRSGVQAEVAAEAGGGGGNEGEGKAKEGPSAGHGGGHGGGA
ncbi:MFS transporter [Kitasatospora sp. NPDC094019]|uniref:MFS transporter n=1 Tax=Kitasatospora sp. NPDC094019 TaxID=3364091 RepID=UPI003810F6A4